MTTEKRNSFFIAIGLIITAFFSIFLVETYNYTLIKDDLWFVDLLTNKGVLNAAVDTYMNVNGRWFSHLWDCAVFKLFLGRYHLFFIYHFFLLASFIIALTLFIKTVFQKQYAVNIPYLKSFLLSVSLTAFFFFFLFEGRVEVWYWVNATGVHLLSLIALLIVINYCIKTELKLPEITLLIISAIAIGGMSESYALMSLIVLLLVAFKKWAPLKKTFLVLGMIVLSLSVNILSSGLQSRLSMLPDFNFLLALRNTTHSLLLPFIQYKYLTLKIGVLIFTYLLAVRIREINLVKEEVFFFGHFFKQTLITISIIAFSFFIPCFLLTDIIAHRMESFGYLYFLLFVFNYFIKYSIGIVK